MAAKRAGDAQKTNTSTPANDYHTDDFPQVCREEAEQIWQRRKNAARPAAQETNPGVPDDLVGLALSGGGIRAALSN